MPLFSVIIPSYNRKAQLINAVESVLAQNERDFELIVVDDGSDDGTSVIADEYYGRLIYIYQDNSGVSSARNKGISISNSPNITLLDSDDTWHKNKLHKHKEFMENNRNIPVHQTGDIWIRNGVRVNPGSKHIKPEGKIFIPSLQLCLISPSSVCISRTIFEKYGLFDEDLPACEDYDLWLRITPFEEIGLIKENLITRYAGHSDQLSAVHWGMDRFRLYSILKMLNNTGDRIERLYLEAALNTAKEKAEILLNGAIKRCNDILAKDLSEIITLLEDGFYKQTDYQNLLKI